MFRVLGRNFAITKYVINEPFKFRSFTTTTPTEHDKEEYNFVKLLGTIVSPTRTLANGAKSLIVRTKEANENYFNHLVNIKSEESFVVGQRIYIFGHLSSKPFTLDDGRLRFKLTIKSKYARLRGHERKTDNPDDLNNVKILAKITSEIQHTDEYSLFTLASNHIPKGDGSIAGMTKTEFHRIIVYDVNAVHIAKNLNKFDRVLVDGKVSYMPFKNIDGKTQHGGFIVAGSIKLIESEPKLKETYS